MVTKSEEQNQLRRAQKQKQRTGLGKKKKTNELNEIDINRHIVAKFCGATAEAIKSHFQNRPEEPITTDWYKNYIKNGNKIEVECPEAMGDISIDFDDIHSGIAYRSVTVFTAGGYGVRFKVIGGFRGMPRKVLIL